MQVLEAPLQSLRERAQRAYDAGDVDGGHQAMVELLAAIPGRFELTAELLGAMRRASMADRRMNRWTEYASERLAALHRAGLLEEDNAELPGAYDCLCVLRWDQGRLWDAWEAMQRLQELDGGNPYVRLGLARMLVQVESPAAIPLMLSVLDAVDGSRNDEKTRQLLMVGDRILTPSWSWEHISILDPWRPVFSRAKFKDQSNQTMLAELKAALAQRRHGAMAAQAAGVHRPEPRQNQAGGDVQPVPDLISQEWSDFAWQLPDKDPAAIDRSIRMTAGAEKPAPAADGLSLLDPWHAFDLRLQQMTASSLNALRQVQEARYKEQIRLRPPEQRTGSEQLAWYRTSAWSATANADLLALAQAELKRGHTASATRSFLDIMNHSVSPAIRQAAQVGIWLAAAGDGTAAGLDAFFEGVDPGALFPWIGKTEKAANIKARLQKGMPAEAREVPSLSDLELRTLRLPAMPVSPADAVPLQHGAGLADLHVHGDRILAGVRNWLAWYDASNPATPLWSVVDLKSSASSPAGGQVPGYWRPAVVNGRMYTRGGGAGAPSQVRALDIESGRAVWATPAPDAPASLRGHQIEFRSVISDPVVAGGCVYYAEIVRRRDNQGGNRLDVVCIEADDGSPVWRSTVVRADDDTAPGREFREAWSRALIWGNAPTISSGSVYLGNAGTAARLDVRDGRVAWVRACRGGLALPQIKSGVMVPLGAPPLVAGDQVLFVPRDYGPLCAVDGRSGGLLWEQFFVRPVELLGTWKDSAVVRTVSELISVALGTGEIRWHVPVPADIAGRCTLRGDVIRLASEDALLTVNAADGILRERRAWPEGTAIWNHTIADKACFVVSDETVPCAGYSTGTLVAADGPAEAKPLRLPFKRAWFLPREHARVFFPPPNSPLQGRIFILAEGMVEAVDVTPQGRSAWRRFTRGPVSRALFDKTTVVLCSGAEPGRPGALVAMAIDGQTGRTLWRLPVFPSAADVMLADGVFLIHDGISEARAYETATGRLLWVRQGFHNPAWQRMDFMAFAQEGQLHLFGFGQQPQQGVVHLRMDLRTGAMLPATHAVEGAGVMPAKRSLIGMGKQTALIRVLERAPGSDKGRLCRYSLAEGKSRDIEGMDMIYQISPPYVVVGKEGGGTRTLLSCDDPSYEYSLADRGDPAFTEGLMMFTRDNKISFVDPATKKLVFELDSGKKQFGGPGVIRLDDTRMLLCGVNGEALELKEIDLQSNRVIREASIPDFNPAGREQLQARPPVVSNMMIFSNNQGIQALVNDGE